MQAPADVEYTAREYLKPFLAVPVRSELGRGAGQVVVFTTGGAKATLVSGRPRLVFDCYGERAAQAWALVQQVWALVEDLDSRMVGGVQFYEIDSTLPVSLPHPDRPDLFRYQFNSVLHARHVRVP